MNEPTLTEQIACVRREIGKRKHFYPLWVPQGRISQEKAAKELQEMEAVLVTLTKLLVDRKDNQTTLF